MVYCGWSQRCHLKWTLHVSKGRMKTKFKVYWRGWNTYYWVIDLGKTWNGIYRIGPIGFWISREQ